MHHLNKRLLLSDKSVSDRPNRREGTSPNVTKGCREHPIACSQVNVSMFSTALPVPGQLSGDLLSVHSVCCSKHWTSDDSWSSDAFLSAELEGSGSKQKQCGGSSGPPSPPGYLLPEVCMLQGSCALCAFDWSTNCIHGLTAHYLPEVLPPNCKTALRVRISTFNLGKTYMVISLYY